MSYTKLLYHVVFRTKKNRLTINQEHEKKLYAYILGIIKNNKSVLYRIGGMEDHIHLLIDLHPTVALSDCMREVKSASSKWLKQNANFPHFYYWAESFGAFTYNYTEKDLIINYIKNQKQHHETVSFEDEFRGLLKENGIDIDEQYFLKD